VCGSPPQSARHRAHICFSISRLFRRHVDSAHLSPPTVCIVRLSLTSNNHPLPLTFCCTRSDPNERAYFWLPGSEATSTHELLDSPVAERLYIDQGEIVRARVERDEFCDDEPGPPKASEGVLISGEARRLPYTVTVSLWLDWPRCSMLTFVTWPSRSAPLPSRVLGQHHGGNQWKPR
jgi:hypothetical protein